MSEFLGALVADEILNIIEKLATDQPAGLEICGFVQAHTAIEEAAVADAFQRLRRAGVSFEQHPAVLAFYQDHLADRVAQGKIEAYADGHPVRSFLTENQLLQRWIHAAEQLTLPEQSADFVALIDQIATVELHYVRKENQLFPLLEKHGWENPSKFMWQFQDANRALLKTTRASAGQEDWPATTRAFAELASELRRMIAIEEARLLPNAMRLLSDDEWQEMRRGDAEIGWMLAEVPAAYPAAINGDGGAEAMAINGSDVDAVDADAVDADAVDADAVDADTAAAGSPPLGAAAITFNQPPRRRKDLPFSTDDKLYFGEGYLTPEQINLIFRFLPVDITYVDENDRVVFYNRGEDRVFSRSAGVIGREVRFCHPPKSVDTVLRIVAEFKAGTKDVADFWINLRGRMVHIRYFAMRDEQRRYRGVLEMTQDITGIRALEGEQRLLDW